MEKSVDLRILHPGESYELCIFGKPIMSYDFHFSDSSCMSLRDEQEAVRLRDTCGMPCSVSFYFTAVDRYDDEMRLFRAPAELLDILRNIQKAGAKFGGERGKAVEIQRGRGSVKYMVCILDDYEIGGYPEDDRVALMELVPPPAEPRDITARISENVPPPTYPANWPDASIEGKEYLAASLDPDGLSDYLCVFVRQIAVSDHPLAESASRIISEMNNASGPYESFNERMRKWNASHAGRRTT